MKLFEFNNAHLYYLCYMYIVITDMTTESALPVCDLTCMNGGLCEISLVSGGMMCDCSDTGFTGDLCDVG